MLTALTEKRQVIQLSMHAKKDHLREIRKKQVFFCPACNERVILKVGEVIIPHFAHMKNLTCDVFSEGETKAHLKGKHLLYNWLKKQTLPVMMEPYLGAIRQRPDLLLKKEESYVAIEFQCSTIQTVHIEARTKGYAKLGMEVLWIALAKKPFFPGLNKMKISQFHQRFIHRQNLILFDVEKRHFHLSRPLLHVAALQFISYNLKLTLAEANYPLTKVVEADVNVQDLMTLWFEERQRYIVNRIRFNKRGLKDPFILCCYIHKITALDLPNWIGIPSTYRGDRHSVEWQLFVIMLLKTVDLDCIYEELGKRYRHIKISIEAVEAYLRFIKRYNPTLKWSDLKNDSISEEITTQFLALKFDN